MRDARGRITQAIGQDGRSVGYGYDGAGNLTSFLDPASRTTRFEYRAAGHPHHLTDLIDWRGVRVAALDYQSDGRLGRSCDADGVCLRSSYDLGARQMVPVDLDAARLLGDHDVLPQGRKAAVRGLGRRRGHVDDRLLHGRRSRCQARSRSTTFVGRSE